MRIDLWSYNYAPEPTGIGPISATWARTMAARGHEVRVIAALPHYPEPVWGSTLRPRRERIDGIPVLRLPIWAGRHSTAQRLRQEITYTGALGLAGLGLSRPEVIVAVSPSFPALAPAMAYAKTRSIPWVLWLQDILPDGAAATGLLEDGVLLHASRRLEQAAYDAAARIAVISESFRQNLLQKGVDDHKISKIYNPATRPIEQAGTASRADVDGGLVLAMGNVGFSQGLTAHVEAFEASDALAHVGARLTIAGDGVAGDEVRGAIRTDRVQITGILGAAALGDYLRRAAVAYVTQSYEGTDFNVPSKLMNFMGAGLPVVASVGLDSEVARIIEASGAGWVADAADPANSARVLAGALSDPAELEARGRAALTFARQHFDPDQMAERFEETLQDATRGPVSPARTARFGRVPSRRSKVTSSRRRGSRS
jgi:colanic acid biosynthesis glycosyl transferase WcaI